MQEVGHLSFASPCTGPTPRRQLLETEWWLDLETIHGLANCLTTNSNVRGRWWTLVDVGGHSTPSDQQIWTLRNGPEHSGNTPKVPGSRPGQPTNSLLKPSLIPSDWPDQANRRGSIGIQIICSPRTMRGEQFSWLISEDPSPWHEVAIRVKQA